VVEVVVAPIRVLNTMDQMVPVVAVLQVLVPVVDQLPMVEMPAAIQWH
jgi:hypothetical protein